MEKRQGSRCIGTLQDACARHWAALNPPGFGVRLSSAALALCAAVRMLFPVVLTLQRFNVLTFSVLLLSASTCRLHSATLALERFAFTSPHMGTLFSITLYATNESSAKAAADAAFHRVADLDEIMSDYRADSELMRLCDRPFGKPVSISQDLFDVFSRSQEVSKLTDGAFDITIGPCVRLWRF
jgi:thiamine biosynthesis lipoprotein ApbE